MKPPPPRSNLIFVAGFAVALTAGAAFNITNEKSREKMVAKVKAMDVATLTASVDSAMTSMGSNLTQLRTQISGNQ